MATRLTHDAAGNRTRVTETVGGVTREISYTYDPLNRLIAADYTTGESYAYQYDAVGNRTVYTLAMPRVKSKDNATEGERFYQKIKLLRHSLLLSRER